MPPIRLGSSRNWLMIGTDSADIGHAKPGIARCPVQAAAWRATALVLFMGGLTVGALAPAWAQPPCGEACPGLYPPGCADRACRDYRLGTQRNLCPACRARLAGGRALQGPLVPLAAQVSDTPFPRFHPVPTRPVFMPWWVGPPAVHALPEAPQPPLLKHLPPTALPKEREDNPSDKPPGRERSTHSVEKPGTTTRPSGDGWRARSTGAIQTSWVFHPAVTGRLEMEPPGAPSTGRAARRPDSVGPLR